jgi:uncharacterized membrane protein YedE/YeeE
MSARAHDGRRPSRSSHVAVALVAGLLFGVGLGVSGMARPTKVLAFLDVAGAWDPTLAFVMIGAIGIHALAVLVAKRRRAPLGGQAFGWPDVTAIDMPLVAGSALFGVGWGLGGYCPGPALLGAASGNLGAAVFVVAMVAGMVVRHTSTRSAPARTS